jgi:uncharacterized protein (TIRG00374 family)
VNRPDKKILAGVSLILVGVMVLALATALLSDFSKIKDVLLHVDLVPFLGALVSTGFAYLTTTLSFRTLFRLTPYRIPFPKFFSIMFISDTVNFIVSSAGMSSIANRAFLLKREKVPYSVTVPLSLTQNMIVNLALSLVGLTALGYLHSHPELTGVLKPGALLVFMVGLLLLVGVMMVFFFNRFFRRWALRVILRAGHWASRRSSRGEAGVRQLTVMLARLENTLVFLRRGWVRLLDVFFWVAMNWLFMALAFYFCFHAVGLDLPLGLLMVGFTVMYLSSNINPVPAGLGVSESLLAFTFKYLGVGFESTLVAALLFRLVYYLIPLGISACLYLDTMRSFLKSPAQESI